jgi:hypothetical protein
LLTCTGGAEGDLSTNVTNNKCVLIWHV